ARPRAPSVAGAPRREPAAVPRLQPAAVGRDRPRRREHPGPGEGAGAPPVPPQPLSAPPPAASVYHPRQMALGVPFGNYRLVRRIARGGMAEVFLAWQRSTSLADEAGEGEDPDGFYDSTTGI